MDRVSSPVAEAEVVVRDPPGKTQSSHRQYGVNDNPSAIVLRAPAERRDDEAKGEPLDHERVEEQRHEG